MIAAPRRKGALKHILLGALLLGGGIAAFFVNVPTRPPDRRPGHGEQAPGASPQQAAAGAPAVPQLHEPVPPPAGLPDIGRKALKQVIDELGDPDVVTRREALKLLPRAGLQATWALPQLYRVLINDDHVPMRKGAADEAARLGPHAVALVPGLCDLLADDDECDEVRARCAAALGDIGRGAKQAIPLLVQVLARPAFTAEAACALVRLGPEASPAVTAALKAANDTTRVKALSALATLGPDAKVMTSLLQELAGQGEPPVRAAALHALGAVGSTDAATLDLGLQALKEKDPGVRAGALAALRPLGAGAAAALEQARSSLQDPSPAVREQAAHLLGSMGMAARASTTDLLARAQDGDARVRVAIAAALPLVGADGRQAAPVMAAALAEADAATRARLALRLGLYGPAAEAAISALIASVKKLTQTEGAEATAALGRIGAPAVPAVLELLVDDNLQRRGNGLAIVQQMAPQGGALIAPLRTALQDARTVWSVIPALQREGPAAVGASADLAALIEGKPEIGKLAATALEYIGADGKAMERLKTLASAKSFEQRRQVAEALGGGGPGAAELLAVLARDQDNMVRDPAKKALARLEARAKLAGWREGLADRDSKTRLQAAQGILQFFPADLPATLVLVQGLRSNDAKERETVMMLLRGRGGQYVEVLKALLEILDDAGASGETKSACKQMLTSIDASLAREVGAYIDWRVPPRSPPLMAHYGTLPMPTRTRLRAPEGSIHCLFRLLVPQPGKVEGDLKPVLVAERARDPWPSRPGNFRGLLARELARQAVLLSARNELGLLTRDLTLRETFPDSQAYATKVDLGLAVHFGSGSEVWLALIRCGAAQERLWQRRFTLPVARPFEYVRLAEEMERCARQEWPAVLRAAGIPASKAVSPRHDPLPDGIEPLLNKMNYLSQFAALRELDRVRRNAGETPDVLGALVRANANLGLLSAHHATAAGKAYQARALLYAQRLLATGPDAALGRWHRAYALALSGLHAAAQIDLAEAERLGAKGAARPAWLPAIDAYCRNDWGALEAAADGPLQRLLHFLMVAHSKNKVLALRAARAVLQDDPDCYCVHNRLCHIGIVALPTDPDAQLRTLPDRLRELGGLPAAVSKALPESPLKGTAEIELLRLLEQAGGLEQDQAEPAWSSLASLYRETRFRQLLDTLPLLQRFGALAQFKPFVQESLPLLADHPYQAAFEVHGVWGDSAPMVARIRPRLDMGELRRHHQEVGTIAFAAEQIEGIDRKYEGLATLHRDDVADDLAFELRDPWGEEKPALARRLLQVSPGHAVARATLIVGDWQAVKDDAENWDQALVLAELALHYNRSPGRSADTERTLKRLVKVSPDHSALTHLADIQKTRGRLDLWEEMMLDTLKREDLFLEHMDTHLSLAYHYMKRKEWQKALPHAEAAASTGAARGNDAAMACYEGLGEWAKAEQMARRNTSYTMGALSWYNWCARTGRGDVAAAVKAALDNHRRADFSDQPPDPLLVALDAMIARQPAKALKMALSSTDKHSFLPMLIAVLADQTGQRDVRDKALQQLPAEHHLGQLAARFRTALWLQSGKVDANSFEQFLEQQTGIARSSCAYFAGRFLETRGHLKAALDCYQCCLGEPVGINYVRALALASLRAHGQVPRAVALADAEDAQ